MHILQLCMEHRQSHVSHPMCVVATFNGERSSKDGFTCTCVFVFVLLTCRCESCLLNRYGVSLEEAEDCKWSCPFCLRTCNCSLCRKKVCMGECVHVCVSVCACVCACVCECEWVCYLCEGRSENRKTSLLNCSFSWNCVRGLNKYFKCISG